MLPLSNVHPVKAPKETVLPLLRATEKKLTMRPGETPVDSVGEVQGVQEWDSEGVKVLVGTAVFTEADVWYHQS